MLHFLREVGAKMLSHGKTSHFIFSKDFWHSLVRLKVLLVFRILKFVFFDVSPKLLDTLPPSCLRLANNVCQILWQLIRFCEAWPFRHFELSNWNQMSTIKRLVKDFFEESAFEWRLKDEMRKDLKRTNLWGSGGTMMWGNARSLYKRGVWWGRVRGEGQTVWRAELKSDCYEERGKMEREGREEE